MIFNRIRFMSGMVAALLAVYCSADARAAEENVANFPNGRINVIVALGAGGSMDTITRLYGQRLSAEFNQPFIVENRGGAAGNLAAETVARAKPDGQTLLVASSGVYAINGTYFKQLPFDPISDLTPIALYVKIPFIFVTRGDSPISTFAELVQAAKKTPGKLTFSSTGISGAPHLAGELLKAELGIDLTHVPYKGAMSQAMADVMAGHVDFIFSDPSLAIPLIKGGRLKALGVSSLERIPQMSDLPTIGEAINAPKFEAVSWHVISAPAKTPKPIIEKLHTAMVTAFKDPTIVEQIKAMGLAPINPPMGTDATKAYIASEKDKWGALLKRLNLAGMQ